MSTSKSNSKGKTLGPLFT